eukprot:gi/632943107/ref/XP_007886777.1/ PREDICTED: chromobox protein homolog 2 [Callorhinchus milii]
MCCIHFLSFRHNSWEPEENILDPRLLLAFQRSQQEKELQNRKRGKRPRGRPRKHVEQEAPLSSKSSSSSEEEDDEDDDDDDDDESDDQTQSVSRSNDRREEPDRIAQKRTQTEVSQTKADAKDTGKKKRASKIIRTDHRKNTKTKPGKALKTSGNGTSGDSGTDESSKEKVRKPEGSGSANKVGSEKSSLESPSITTGVLKSSLFSSPKLGKPINNSARSALQTTNRTGIGQHSSKVRAASPLVPNKPVSAMQSAGARVLTSQGANEKTNHALNKNTGNTKSSVESESNLHNSKSLSSAAPMKTNSNLCTSAKPGSNSPILNSPSASSLGRNLQASNAAHSGLNLHALKLQSTNKAGLNSKGLSGPGVNLPDLGSKSNSNNSPIVNSRSIGTPGLNSTELNSRTVANAVLNSQTLSSHALCESSGKHGVEKENRMKVDRETINTAVHHADNQIRDSDKKEVSSETPKQSSNVPTELSTGEETMSSDSDHDSSFSSTVANPSISVQTNQDWKPTRSLIEHVFVTDVTANLVTVTVKESPTSVGFFNMRHY